MTRPQGTPGRFTFGCGTFDAILDRHGTYWWQSTSGHWYEAPPRAALMIAPRFEVDRAWHRANNEDDRPAADREAALWGLWSADLHCSTHDTTRAGSATETTEENR